MSYLDLEVRIHSRFADTCPSAIKLWYLCRALSDTGKAEFEISKVAQTFNVCLRTVRGWISSAIQLNYFRKAISLGNGKYQVYYSSLVNLCAKRGLNDFGAVGFATIKEVVDLKTATAQIAAESLQRSSRYLANLEAKNYQKPQDKTSRAKLPWPEELFDRLPAKEPTETPPSDLCPGVLGFSPDRRLLFVGQNFKPYGASQAGIADKLDRSAATIQRRLKSIRKLRVARFDRNNCIEHQIALDDWAPQAGRFLKVNSLLLCPNPKALGRTFKLLTNIYYPEYMLNSAKFRRRQLKSKCARLTQQSNRSICTSLLKKEANNKVDFVDEKLTSRDCLGSAYLGTPPTIQAGIV